MKILNIENLSVGNFSDIVSFCSQRIQSGEGAFLIPMNPIKVIKARKNKEFQEIIDRADWVFADSFGIRLAASILYRKTIPITPGYQVMFKLFELAEKQGKSVYLLGTTDEILELAKLKIRSIYPCLKIVESHNGFFSDAEAEAIFIKIADYEPDFVFVAMGEHKQEVTIEKLRVKYKKAICMGVGGSVDLIAGKQPTPPKWVQRNHLEWLYRLFRQPFRIPRFKALPIFLYLVIKEKLKRQ